MYPGSGAESGSQGSAQQSACEQPLIEHLCRRCIARRERNPTVLCCRRDSAAAAGALQLARPVADVTNLTDVSDVANVPGAAARAESVLDATLRPRPADDQPADRRNQTAQ